MASAEFCVLCGRSGVALEGGICAECAADRRPLLRAPPRATVVLCPTCGARRVGQRWERAGTSQALTAEDLNRFWEADPEVGVRRVDWEETGGASNVRSFRARARVRFRGLERTVDFPLRVKIEHRTCADCSRRSGHYYTALLQLRGPEKRDRERPADRRARLERAFEALLAESPAAWRTALSWREPRPEGWDYYLTDTPAARALAREFRARLGATLKESASLAGRKDGREVYRVTFAIRLAPGAAGRASGRRELPVERQT